MAKVKHRRVKRLVLDIGSSAVRLCEISQTKTGYQLSKYYQREMVIDPALDEDAKKVIRRDTLKALLKDSKSRTAKVILAMPGQSVFTRPNRALPPVPEYKVTQIVRYEIQQQIPFSLDQIALDYQILRRTDAGGYDVMMAAVKVDVVEKHLEILKQVKRQIATVDVSPLAAYNWLKHTGEFGDQGDCVALLDLGASTTDIVVERDSQFRFTRSLNLGGNDITSALSEGFGVSFAEAEKLKRERGFAPTGDPQRDGKGGEAIGRVLRRLVSEITRSFAYFRSQPGGGTVSRVVVTGGGACLRNMIPYLQRQLGVEVRIAQPLAGLAIAPAAQEVSAHPEQAAVVLGLALRCHETVPLEINLIPPRVLETARRKEQAVYYALSIVAAGLIMASMVPATARKNKEVLAQIQQATSIMRRYDPNLRPGGTSDFAGRLQTAKQLVEGFKDDVTNLDRAKEDRGAWLEKLRAINDARPEAKTLVFSSVETAVIGGPGNTRGGSGEVTTSSSGGGMASPFGEMGGDNPFAALFGGGGGDMFGGMDMGAASPQVTLDVTGFPGLGRGEGGGSGDGGGDMGGMFAMMMGGGMEEPAEEQSDEPEKDIVFPNGFTIRGYADSPETIQLFVERLKASKAFESGVYFDDASAKPVPISTLDNTGVATDSGSGPMGAMSDMGGMFSGAGGSMGSSTGANPYEQQVITFTIHVQFDGKHVDLEGAQPEAEE